MNEDIVNQLIKHEGLRLKPYQDTVGKWTIGVGRNFDDVKFSKEELLELIQTGVTYEWCMMLLDNDITQTITECQRFDWFDDLSDVRKKVIIDMVFNMGLTLFRGFKKTIDYISRADYDSAATEMLDSTWKTQVGTRAITLSNMMRYNK